MQQAVRISNQNGVFSCSVSWSNTVTQRKFSRSRGINEPKTTSQGGLDDMRRRFDEELQLLNKKLIEMGAQCAGSHPSGGGKGADRRTHGTGAEGQTDGRGDRPYGA